MAAPPKAVELSQHSIAGVIRQGAVEKPGAVRGQSWKKRYAVLHGLPRPTLMLFQNRKDADAVAARRGEAGMAAAGVVGAEGGAGAADVRATATAAAALSTSSSRVKYELPLHARVQVLISKDFRSGNHADPAIGIGPDGFVEDSVLVLRDTVKHAELVMRCPDISDRKRWTRDLKDLIRALDGNQDAGAGAGDGAAAAAPGGVVVPPPPIEVSGISRTPGLRLEGWVEKPGKLKAKNWNKRYGAVINRTLALYDGRPMMEDEIQRRLRKNEFFDPQREGNLSPKYETVLGETTKAGKDDVGGFKFRVRDTRRDIDITLRVASPEEQAEWIRALTDAIEDKPTPTQIRAAALKEQAEAQQRAAVAAQQQQQQAFMQQQQMMMMQQQQAMMAAAGGQMQMVMTPMGPQMMMAAGTATAPGGAAGAAAAAMPVPGAAPAPGPGGAAPSYDAALSAPTVATAPAPAGTGGAAAPAAAADNNPFFTP